MCLRFHKQTRLRELIALRLIACTAPPAHVHTREAVDTTSVCDTLSGNIYSFMVMALSDRAQALATTVSGRMADLDADRGLAGELRWSEGTAAELNAIYALPGHVEAIQPPAAMQALHGDLLAATTLYAEAADAVALHTWAGHDPNKVMPATALSSAAEAMRAATQLLC